MPNCSMCGRQVPYSDIVYTGGMELCRTCEASGVFSTDAPCSRCGVYIPRTELQMFRSRLYCNYCIMDMRFEEKERTDRETRINRDVTKAPAPTGSAPDSPGGSAIGVFTGEQVREKNCDICGRTSDTIYYFGTIKVCKICKGGLDPDFDKVAKKGFGSNIPIVSNFIGKRRFKLKKGIGKKELVQIVIRNLGAQKARIKAGDVKKTGKDAKDKEGREKKPMNIEQWAGLEVEDIDGVEALEGPNKQEDGKKRKPKERKGIAMPVLGMSEAGAISRLEKRLSKLAGYDQKGYVSLRERIAAKHAKKVKSGKAKPKAAVKKAKAHSKKSRKK